MRSNTKPLTSKHNSMLGKLLGVAERDGGAASGLNLLPVVLVSIGRSHHHTQVTNVLCDHHNPIPRQAIGGEEAAGGDLMQSLDAVLRTTKKTTRLEE